MIWNIPCTTLHYIMAKTTHLLKILITCLPVNADSFAVHQSLGRAPAKSNKLRVSKHGVQVPEEPGFSFGVWKERKSHFIHHLCLHIRVQVAHLCSPGGSCWYRWGILSRSLCPSLLAPLQTSSVWQHGLWPPDRHKHIWLGLAEAKTRTTLI